MIKVLYFMIKKYDGFKLISISSSLCFFIKYPYLKRSYINNRNVSSLISEKLFGTAILAFFAILFASILGLILGSYTAYNNNPFSNQFSLLISIAGMSAPSFFMASIVSVVGGYYWSTSIDFPVLPLVFMLLSFILVVLLKRKIRLLKSH